MRILFVAMGDSVHTARWMGQLRGRGLDIHFFPATAAIIHPDLKEVTVHSLFRQRSGDLDASVKQTGLAWPLSRGRARAQRMAERLLSVASSAVRLARLIQELKPDIVHSLEMQHAGYLTLESKKLLQAVPFPPWIYSSWGSDLYYFGRRPEHRARIKAVLRSCDYYIADCQRDVGLAREFGFEGEVLGVFPGVGGFDLDHMKQLRQTPPVSARRVIVLKGYHDDNWAGRALVALKALEKCRETLAGYQVLIYSASPQVRHAADDLSRGMGLQFTILPPSPHDEILRWMGRARIAIGVSVTDGTPNSMLEAMLMGAFPIQSDTVSTAEWITSGDNGFLVPPEDPEAIAVAIRRALSDNTLVDRAAEINERITMERIDRSVIQPQVIAMYEKVAARAAEKSKKGSN